MKPYINNKRARRDFSILETFEAGIILDGQEVKSLRKGNGSLKGAHVLVRGGEAYLVGASIPPFQPKNAPKDFDQERLRKLLLSRKEIAEISHKSDEKGLTAIPLSLYNKGSKIKLEIGIVRGKKKEDKREAIKERDTKRDIERTLKTQYK